MKTLRAKCINKELFKDTLWVLETPYDVRDEAMRDLLKAYKTNFAAKRQHFEMKFKSKKAPSDSIAILSKHYKSKGIFFPSFWGKAPIKAREELPDKPEYDSRIVRTRLGHFYFCIPTPIVINSNTHKHNIIALDPGIRTFCTGYDPAGRALEWGRGDIGRIYRLCYAYDKLQSKWSQAGVRHSKRYRYKKAGLKIHRRIRNLVDDLHKKLSSWLCKHYDNILLPEFETQQMTAIPRRKINSKTARAMLTWSHYRFQQRLLIKLESTQTAKSLSATKRLHQKPAAAVAHLIKA